MHVAVSLRSIAGFGWLLVAACQPSSPPHAPARVDSEPIVVEIPEPSSDTASSSETETSPTPPPKPRCAYLDELWDFGDPEASEQRFVEAAQQAAASGDTDCELEALTQQARARGLRGDFDGAHEILEGVRLRLPSERARPNVRYLLERGRALNSAKRVEAAKRFFVAAWKLARELGDDGLAVDAAHMVAIAQSRDPDAALEWNLRAIELAQSSPDESAQRWLGSLYNNTGWTYFDRGEYERAHTLFERGVEFRREQGKLVPLLIARWAVARTLRALGRVEEALAEQERLRAEYEANGMPPNGFVYEELAECTLALGRAGHEQLFRRAFELLSQDASFREAEPERLERLRQLGGVAPSAQP